METLHQSEIRKHEEAIKAVRSQADREAAVAMRTACDGLCVPPTDIAAAARVITDLRAKLSSAMTAHAMVGADVARWETFSKQALAGILKGEPESADPSFKSVEALVARLKSAIQDHKAMSADVMQHVRDTFTDMGLAELPALVGYFSGATPLLAAAEAAAVLYSIVKNRPDRLANERYLRRRGWTMRQTGWLDPVGKLNLPFEAAVLNQFDRDVAPFTGLLSRQWKSPKPKLELSSTGNPASDVSTDIPSDSLEVPRDLLLDGQTVTIGGVISQGEDSTVFDEVP